VGLIDTFGNLLGAAAGAFGQIAPVLQSTGVLPFVQQQPIFGMPGSGFPVQQASANLEGVFNIPALGPGTAITGPAGGGSLGCITPVTSMTTRLPRTVDVPVQDAAGNVKISTYVKAPRVSYKVSIRPQRRPCRRGRY